MASARGVVGMQKGWGDPRRRFASTTAGARVVDAHRTSGLALQVEAEVTTADRTGVPVGTRAGTVCRVRAGAAIGVVTPVPPRVTHSPRVTARRCVGHLSISRSLFNRSGTTCSTR